MSDKLQNIKLGAPRIIRGGACPNATLDVQVASRVDEIDLRDGSSKCTKDGALVSALKVMRQIVEEKNAQPADGYQITYDEDDYVNFFAHGGQLQLSISKDGVVIPNSAFIWDIEVLEGNPYEISITNGGLLIADADTFYRKFKVVCREYATRNVVEDFLYCNMLVKYPNIDYRGWMIEANKLTSIPIDVLSNQFSSKGNEFYKTDGLCFMVDVCHKCSREQWEDLIEGMVFNGVNTNLNDEGVPIFDGTSYYEGIPCKSHNALTNTIEIVFKSQKTTNQIVYAEDKYGANSQSSLVVGWSNGYLTKSNTSLLSPKFTTSNYLTLLSWSDICVINKEIIVLEQNNYYGGGGQDKTIIGKRSNGVPFYGNIYAIRIYDRLLTKEEILHNQTIDLARFANM